MVKQTPELPFGGASTASKVELQQLLKPIRDTLLMVVSRDQRLAAKHLYHQKAFSETAKEYLVAILDLDEDFNNRNIETLNRRAAAFINTCLSIYPNDSRRMLTALRRDSGASLSVLYKNTIRLIDRTKSGIVDEDFQLRNVPDQKPSSIQTKIESDRIVLDAGRALNSFLRKDAVDETRRYLRSELDALDASLGASNVDRKYVESFKKLNILIEFKDDAGAISFGLHVRLMSQLTKQIEDEISEILLAQITSTLTHAAYFASQYKDWTEFLRNAQNYPSRQLVDNDIDAALRDVIDALEHNPKVVDEKIPESIRLILSLLKGSKEDRINAIYGGVRGVENICIATVKYSYDQAVQLLHDAGKKARPTIVGLGAVAIIGVALMVISNFMPIIIGAPELNWILENLPQIEKLGRILK